MVQSKFSLAEENIEFLSRYKDFGFKDKSDVIRTALQLLQKELEKEQLKSSASVYAGINDEDSDVRELTESAIHGWPE
mgnify:CR=1 FL=1